MRRSWFALSLLGMAANVSAGLYLQVPGIPGETDKPGYPDAMQIESMTIVPNAFWQFVKAQDTASDDLMVALLNGAPLASASLLYYNAPEQPSPDAVATFESVLLTAFTTLGGNRESVGANADGPRSMYLHVAPINGLDSAPGYANAMRLTEFTLHDDGSFEIQKLADSASLEVAQARDNETVFAAASILFYDTLLPGASPDAIFTFHNVLAKSSQVVGGGASPGIEFTTYTFAAVTPEPTSALSLIGLAAGAVLGRKRRNG